MKKGSAESYYCFTRTWWRENSAWPNGLEPHPGRRHTLARGMSEQEALDFCEAWNEKHKPGRLSRKCEFDSQ